MTIIGVFDHHPQTNPNRIALTRIETGNYP